jgi:hypothetical protein
MNNGKTRLRRQMLNCSFLIMIACAVTAPFAGAAYPSDQPPAPSAEHEQPSEHGYVDFPSLSADEQAMPAPEPETGLKFFSDEGRVFPPLLADPNEAQIRIGFLRELRQGESMWETSFGGDFGLMRYQPNNIDEFSLTIRALITARFESGSDSLDLLNTDFIGGAALGYRRNVDAFELFVYHESSHLGDEELESGERERLDFAHETLRLLWSHEFPSMRLYAGPSVNLHSDLDELEGKTAMQGGVEYPFMLCGRRLYAAVDLQSKEEHDWNANVAAQVGLELGDERLIKRQRIFLEYFDGFSNMGHFYDERERYILLGIAFDPTPSLYHGHTAVRLSESDEEQPESALSSWNLELFSDEGRVFAPLLADPREAQARAGLMQDIRRGETLWDVMLGGDLGLIYYEPNETGAMSLSARGLIASRFNQSADSFDLMDIDFRGGLAAGYRSGADAFELFLYHERSHLGDEMLDRGNRERIDFSREALRFLWSHDFAWARLYGGPSINLRAEPDELDGKTTFQAGAERSFSVGRVPLYVALDLQSKEEHDWTANVTGQFGLDFGDSPHGIYKSRRIFLEYFQGFSNMGQFYDERERYVLLGIGLFI